MDKLFIKTISTSVSEGFVKPAPLFLIRWLICYSVFIVSVIYMQVTENIFTQKKQWQET